MTNSGLYELQVGILNYLKTVSNLTSLLATTDSIYDVPPPNAVYPFILIGSMKSEEWGTRDAGGQKVEATIQAYTNGSRGSAMVKKIGDTVRIALDNQETSITLAAGKITLCQFAAHDEELSRDAVEWIGTTRLNILLET